METKEHIRKEVLEARKLLSFSKKMALSDSITERMTTLSQWKRTDSILLYADFRNEVMTDKMILTALLQGKKVYLPKIMGNDMNFYRIYGLEDLYAGYMGIREPMELFSEQYHAEEEHTLCITPGAVFDPDGIRIGYGKGYYDRFLSANPIETIIGAAYELQIKENLPFRKEDQKVHGIVTEARTIICEERP